MKDFLYRNGLGLVLTTVLLLILCGQMIAGHADYNEERKQAGQHPISMGAYIFSPHSIARTFENWESEFLQCGVYVLLTVWLRQWGSAESKPLKVSESRPGEPRIPVTPWPVRAGGIWLRLYNNSLSGVFFLMFFISFWAHFCGSLRLYNEKQLRRGEAEQHWAEYLASAHFWFESLQNWQSEFLAVLCLVVLSIWLRQKGSPESKPVDAPHTDTGK